MTGTALSTAVAGEVHPGPFLRLGGRVVPVRPPTLRDPRLVVAATITTIHVLGQTSFHFELSIAQWLVAVGTAAVLDLTIVGLTTGVLAWPASGLLAGNGIALLLRVDGTEHGDWWSGRGLWIFYATAAVAILSKHLVRVGGRPLFNPSNVALVGCFLLLGSDRVEPLDLWWAPLSPAMVAAYVVVLGGGLLVTHRVGMLGASAGFAVTFGLGALLLGATGHCMTARWHVGPVSDGLYRHILWTSPEILVFLFLMITDPRTVPSGRVGRVVHGALTGAVATVLVAAQTTEFATKVALLVALVVVTAMRPALERVLPAPGTDADDAVRWLAGTAGRRTGRILRVGGTAALVAGATLLVADDGARPDPTAAASTASTVPGEPAPVRPDVPLPPVELDDAVGRLQGGPSRAEAEAMTADLLADLALVGEAVAQRDASHADAGTTDDYEAVLAADLASGSAPPVPDVHRDDLELVTVLVLRASEDPQAAPTIGLRLEGAGADGSPIDRIYVLVKPEDRWLLHREHALAEVIVE